MTRLASRRPRPSLLVVPAIPGVGMALAPLAGQGQLSFFTDRGAFLLDLGNLGAGKSRAKKVLRVEVKTGAGDSFRKSLPSGAHVRFGSKGERTRKAG